MEFAELLINQRAIHTVAVESADIAEVLRRIKELDIDKRENTNYLEAIKRIIGLEAGDGGEHC
jgi:hypothetical protein